MPPSTWVAAVYWWDAKTRKRIQKNAATIKNEKVRALQNHLDLDDEEVNNITFNGNEFIHGDREYLVLEDEEADKRAEEYIKDTAWAFKPSFLSAHTGIDEDVFNILSEKCEDSNNAVLSMIKDFDHFVSDAISSDGRGHFIATYDHDESIEEINNTEYFIYRTN